MLYKTEKLRNQTLKTHWMGPNPNGSLNCDRAFRYSGFFFGVHTVGQMVVFDLGTRSVPGRVELTPMMSSRGVLTIKVQEIFFLAEGWSKGLKTISWKFNTAPKSRQPRKEVVFQSLFITAYVKLPGCSSLTCPRKIDGEDEISCLKWFLSKIEERERCFFLLFPCVGGESCSACPCW